VTRVTRIGVAEFAGCRGSRFEPCLEQNP
jgi:hypothetical protein